MKNIQYIIQWLSNLSNTEKGLLLQLIKQDNSSLLRLLLKISRIKLAAETGNIILWKKIKADEEKDISEFNGNLKDQTKITRIQKGLGLPIKP